MPPQTPRCSHFADRVDHLGQHKRKPSEGISGGYGGTSERIEKDLSTEEKIPAN